MKIRDGDVEERTERTLAVLIRYERELDTNPFYQCLPLNCFTLVS